ncbi:MAG TPA: hypothetical protein EYG16_06460 [Deltaproteobacteria bacterium]|nr:hypothetical protein [Candidatus Binatota bacterium]HIL13296.1 hypothetical protein [Deltaproteobacteria bacterium]
MADSQALSSSNIKPKATAFLFLVLGCLALAGYSPSAARAAECDDALTTQPKAVEKYVKAHWKAILRCSKKGIPSCPEICPLPSASEYGLDAACETFIDAQISGGYVSAIIDSWDGAGSCAISAADACNLARGKAAAKITDKALKRRRKSKADKYPKDLLGCAKKADKPAGGCGGVAMCADISNWVFDVDALALSKGGYQQVRFETAVEGQATAAITMAAPGTDWGAVEDTAIVVEYDLDGASQGTAVLYGGGDSTAYRVQLGALSAGVHTLGLRYRKKLGTVKKAPALLESLAINVLSLGDPGYDALRVAPVLLGIDTNLNPYSVHPGNGLSDVPVVMTWDASSSGGVTSYFYVMAWSNEDGGTGLFPEVLISQWGRPHDIETIVRVDVDDTTGNIVAAWHRFDESGSMAAFTGTMRGGTHPVVRTRTANGLIADDGDSDFVFGLVPFEREATGSRERILLLEPVSWVVAAKEFTREFKTELNPNATAAKPSNLRNYLWVEYNVDTDVGTQSIRGRAVVDGTVYLSDHGQLSGGGALGLLSGEGYSQVGIEVPEGTTPAQVSSVGIQGVGTMSGTLFDLHVFMLDNDYYPTQEVLTFSGSLAASGAYPSWMVSP